MHAYISYILLYKHPKSTTTCDLLKIHNYSTFNEDFVECVCEDKFVMEEAELQTREQGAHAGKI